MCAFCLLLDSGGLMLAIVATIFIAAAAEPEHRGGRAVAVLGLTVFLLALCWWVFIKQLDIRVNVWPQF